MALPGILIATVIVAGLFAFAPIEQASTVHNTVIDSVTQTLIDSVAQKQIFNKVDNAVFVSGTNTDIITPSSTLKQGNIQLISNFESGVGNRLVISNCLDEGCERLNLLFTSETGTEHGSKYFIGYGIILSESTTGSKSPSLTAGSVSALVTYNEE